jgi:hypothetical protein
VIEFFDKEFQQVTAEAEIGKCYAEPTGFVNEKAPRRGGGRC